MPGDKTYPLSAVASICHRDSISLTCSNARKIPARCREKMLLSLYQPRESFLWHLQSSQNQLFLNLGKVSETFFGIHKHSPLYLLTSSVKPGAPSSPRERRFLIFLALFKARSFRGLKRDSSFWSNKSILQNYSEYYSKKWPKVEVYIQFHNSTEALLHTN